MAKDRRTVLLANIIRLDEDPFMQFASSSEVIMIITFIKPIPAVPPVAFSLFSSHNLIPLLILNNFPLCSLRSVRRLRLSLCVVSARAHLPLLSLSLARPSPSSLFKQKPLTTKQNFILSRSLCGKLFFARFPIMCAFSLISAGGRIIPSDPRPPPPPQPDIYIKFI
jgi:hypothetical protein